MARKVNEPFDFWKQDLNPTTVGERIAVGLIEMTWTAPHPDSGDSDRGAYVTSIRGTDFRISPFGGWHAMEGAIRMAQEAYRVIADAIDSAVVKAEGKLAHEPQKD